METIRIYLENLFSSLPKDERLMRTKSDLLCTMEDKYTELKAEGKSENEAVGVVISEFGNIDELLDEMGISRSSAAPAVTEGRNVLFLDDNAADEYVGATKRFASRIALGVMLMILAPAALLLLSSTLRQDIAGTVGIMALVTLIIIAVMIFIVSGINHDKYDGYEDKMISMPENTRKRIIADKEKYRPHFVRGICVGVALCILCGFMPMICGMFNTPLAGICGVPALLLTVAVGVYHIVRVGPVDACYKILLGENSDKDDDEDEDKKSGNRFVDSFCAGIWPIAVGAFLIWGICFNGWHPAWVIFPVTGLLCAAVSAVAEAAENHKK